MSRHSNNYSYSQDLIACLIVGFFSYLLKLCGNQRDIKLHSRWPLKTSVRRPKMNPGDLYRSIHPASITAFMSLKNKAVEDETQVVITSWDCSVFMSPYTAVG